MATFVQALILLAVFMLPGLLKAQEFPFWGSLEKGPHAVGFRDTVLLNKAMAYTYHSYSGAKPFLVSIWYPAAKSADQDFMNFRDYMDYRRFTRYKMVVDTLRSRYNNIYIRDAVCKNINTMHAIDFDEPQRELFEEILDARVFATRKLTPLKENFPIVYYHHGAQSTPFDNVVFCEYMASHGYIVVSSNYLWPVAGKRNIGADDEIRDMVFVIGEIRKLCNDNIPFMIGTGHSWGGQNLLLYDTLKEKPFRQIVAFHTTIEDKSLVEARDWWPYFVDLFLGNTSAMTTPTIVIAPEIIREDIPTFFLFRENRTTPYAFVTVKTKDITHDGFITLGNLRAPFARKYQLEDSTKLLEQHRVYQEILRLTRDIIEQKERPDKVDASFQGLFGVENVN